MPLALIKFVSFFMSAVKPYASLTGFSFAAWSGASTSREYWRTAIKQCLFISWVTVAIGLTVGQSIAGESCLSVMFCH